MSEQSSYMILIGVHSTIHKDYELNPASMNRYSMVKERVQRALSIICKQGCSSVTLWCVYMHMIYILFEHMA